MRHAAVPEVYYLYWIILIVIMTLMLGYWVFYLRAEECVTGSRRLAGLVVLLTVSLYLLSQTPMLHRHFDPLLMVFVSGYHEPLVQGFIRFLYKVGVALLLLGYAFTGIKKH